MTRFSIIFLTIALSLILIALWWRWGTAPVNKNDKASKIFVIEKAEGIRSIAKNLKEEGLIKNQVVFFVLVKKLGLDGKIQAGDFRLSPSMDPESIAKELTIGTLDAWITIPEGYRSEEIARVLEEKIPTYRENWSSLLSKREGYLFPDTYLIPKDADISLVINIMTNNFDIKWQTLNLQTSKLQKQEIVILASVVEREAKFDQDRPLVAGILVNRLNIGMALQADSTVQYAKGTPDNWWKTPKKEDLKINSPFNTYNFAGLPPSPIANPGLPSLEAAANPADTPYLYYLSDKEGKMHYAKDLEEHNRNIQEYL